MRILSVILLLLPIYIAADSLFLPSNEVQVQKSPEIISDDLNEEYKLAYNKSALLVRKKRSILATVLITFGLPYLCYVLVGLTPFDASFKRWALKYWGFREGQEAARWKQLAKLVQRNVPLDADGNLDEEEGIRDFIDAPPELEGQVERFRGEATLTMTKIMEDEVEEEERMKQKNGENQDRGINAPILLSKVKKWQHLDQMTKAMMADNMIFTLISVNGMGETTWKVNPKKKEHRDIYEALKKIKAAIDGKYKNQCKLKKITANDLPEFKAWHERLLGVLPPWFQNLFKGVKAAEHEPIEVSEETAKKINEIRAMAEMVLESSRKAKEGNRDKKKHAAELIEPLKNLTEAVKVLPTKEELLKGKVSDDKVGQLKSKQLKSKVAPDPGSITK